MSMGWAETTIKCCVCGVLGAKHWRRAGDHLLGGPRCFNAVKCIRCGTVRLDPRPSEDAMGKHYAPNTYARAECDSGSSGLAVRLQYVADNLATRMEKAYGEANRCSFLDVGCGDGRVMAAMSRSGWSVTGVETDAVAAKIAAERTGANVHLGSIHTLEAEADTYDLIAFVHCLEHVVDPRKDLQRAVQLLRPGGTIYVVIPNVDCAEADFFGSCWYALDLPRHYWGFTPRSLQRILEETGFSLTQTHYQPLVNTLQSFRYVLRAVSGKPLGSQEDGATGRNDTPKSLRTKLFTGQQKVSDTLGKLFQGEVMEIAALKPE